jgi:hypothetical protein
MMLHWDGLQVRIPDTMEPATLDRGFIRLVGPGLPTVNLRFGPEKRRFDPQRDGRRILRAAGLAQEPLAPCRKPWAGQILGDLYSCKDRLYVVQFNESRGVAAALFSASPPSDLAERIITSLGWTPFEKWRRWSCYDITFETPPGYELKKAVFQPGRFQLTFSKGSSVLSFDRLAPADILLGDMTLIAWCKQHLLRDISSETTILPRSGTEAECVRKPSFIYRFMPWLPGLSQPLRGKIRHIPEDNKILALTTQGRQMADVFYERLQTSYANIPPVKN